MKLCLFLILLAVIFHPLNGLRCYNCRSDSYEDLKGCVKFEWWSKEHVKAVQGLRKRGAEYSFNPNNCILIYVTDVNGVVLLATRAGVIMNENSRLPVDTCETVNKLAMNYMKETICTCSTDFCNFNTSMMMTTDIVKTENPISVIITDTEPPEFFSAVPATKNPVSKPFTSPVTKQLSCHNCVSGTSKNLKDCGKRNWIPYNKGPLGQNTLKQKGFVYSNSPNKCLLVHVVRIYSGETKDIIRAGIFMKYDSTLPNDKCETVNKFGSGLRETICTCSTDLCNGQEKTAVNGQLIITSTQRRTITVNPLLNLAVLILSKYLYILM